jgi:hypothetical protein
MQPGVAAAPRPHSSQTPCLAVSPWKESAGKLKHAPRRLQAVDPAGETGFSPSPSNRCRDSFRALPGLAGS